MKNIILKDGRTLEITGEEGKYWVCGEERFRKLSSLIAEVREEADAPKPKKKAAKKKKAATEDAEDGERGE